MLILRGQVGESGYLRRAMAVKGRSPGRERMWHLDEYRASTDMMCAR